jgi:uncharacterized membrane protein YkvA (DUF1232 family)
MAPPRSDAPGAVRVGHREQIPCPVDSVHGRVSPLDPLSSAEDPMRISFDLSDADLKHFRSVMRDVRARTKNKSEAEIIGASRTLLEEMKDATAPDFVTERIERLRDLIEMLEDEDWALSGKDRERVVSGLAYFAEPEDIIPDKVPVLGYLDDAIMVELVVIELEHELEAYADFCEFRETREARFGDDEDPKIREEWIVARRKSLHQRMRRRRSRRRNLRTKSGRSPIALW